jgi:hypothetical protein
MNKEPHSTLEKALSALPRDRMPEVDLWPGIARTIRCRRRTRQVAGFGATLVMAEILAFSLGLFSPSITPGGRAVSRAAPPISLAAAFVTRAAADPTLPLPVRKSLPADLLTLDQARSALERSLVRDPDAPAVRGLLVQVETERARFLATVEDAQLHTRNWQ